MTIPLSILDLAVINRGSTAADAFEASVAMAQQAENRGDRRVWYAEHHNMATIASSTTSVLIAHVSPRRERAPTGTRAKPASTSRCVRSRNNST